MLMFLIWKSLVFDKRLQRKRKICHCIEICDDEKCLFYRYDDRRRDVASVLDEQGWERIKDTDGLTREGPVGNNIKRKNKKINLEEELKVSPKVFLSHTL